MSRYGYFSCVDNKVIIWLGKAVYRDVDGESEIYYYKAGGDETIPPNPQQPLRNGAIWKMLAEHHLHLLHVILDEDDEYDEGESDYTEVSGSMDKDISFKNYLKDWPG